MASFDAYKEWIILIPSNVAAAKKGAEELSYHIELLRGRTNQTPSARNSRALGFSSGPRVLDIAGEAPPESIPIIILNSEKNRRGRNGFTWRSGQDRIEIYGESDRGLLKGVYDFLGALGISWPEPGRESLPPPRQNTAYPLRENSAYKPTKTWNKITQKRFLFGGDGLFPIKEAFKKRENLVAWAARNGADTLILPLKTGVTGLSSQERQILIDLAENYALIAEAGGWALSLLVPRGFFFFHSELFRMEGGRRRRTYNFCPTNPETLALLMKEADRCFRNLPEVEVFHLWPDRGHERNWCSCPTCRAFTPAEQNRIAVNAAADVLKVVNPQASISCFDIPGEGENIALRPNIFVLPQLPGDSLPSAEGAVFLETLSLGK